MKATFIGITFAALSSAAVASVPTVTVTSTSQDANSRKVTIQYSVAGEPAIVTPSVQTNRGDGTWVDIGDGNLTFFAGDMNKLVGVGSHTATWRPDKAWPDHLISDKSLRIGVTAWATNAPLDYMVVDLATEGTVRFYTSAAALPDGGVTADVYKTDRLVMRRIPAANVTYRMGSPTTELGRNSDYETPHEVTLTYDFYIGVYEVTQRQYEILMGSRPSLFKLDSDYATRPVECVCWWDLCGDSSTPYWPSSENVPSSSFLYKLRDRSKIGSFHLPLNSQWEYACRAGCGSALYIGEEITNKVYSANLNTIARYQGNAYNGEPISGRTIDPATATTDYGTAKVGSYQPNAWGLYDMLGNVKEWFRDGHWTTPPADPEIGPTSGSLGYRCLCNGSWDTNASKVRCASRASATTGTKDNTYGFRVSCKAVFSEALIK